MRALKITAVLLVLALLVADRVGAVVAAGVIATRLQTVGSLTSKPDVSIRGWPFLTQAISGRYDRIELTTADLDRKTIALSRFEVTVTGARVRLADALGGRVGAVPVEGLTATAVIGYGAISDRSRMLEATLTRTGTEVLVTGKVAVLGKTLTVRFLSRPSLEGSRLVLSPLSIDLAPKSPALLRAVMPLLELRINIGTLPYGLRLTGLKITDGGIELQAKSGPTVLQQPS